MWAAPWTVRPERVSGEQLDGAVTVLAATKNGSEIVISVAPEGVTVDTTKPGSVYITPPSDLTLPYKLLIKWIFMTFPERRIHLQTFDSTQYQTLWSKVADQINDFMQPEYTAWLIQPEPIVDDVDPLRQQLKTTQAFKLVAEFDESFSHVTLRPYAAESFGFKSVLLQRTEDGQLVFKYFYLREDRKTHMDEIYQVLSLLPSLRKELETKCNIKFDVYRALRSVEEISKNQSHSSLTSIVALPISLCDYEARVVE